MAACSKPMRIAFSCYDVGHTWCPSCSDAALQIWFGSFFESIKIYSIVYFVTALIQRKRVDREFFRNILQSSLFLSFNGFGFIGFFCFARLLTGGHTVLTSSFLPALLASFTAIFIEKSSRRKLLSMYVANVATETLLITVTNRGWRVPSPKSLTWMLLFSCVISASFHLKEIGWLPKGLLSQLLSWAKGRPPYGRGKGTRLEMSEGTLSGGESAHDLPEVDSTARLEGLRSSVLGGRKAFVPEHQKLVKTLRYCSEGFLEPFAMGTFLTATMRIASRPQALFRKPARALVRVFANRETYKLGLFFGSFAGIYRVAASILAYVRGSRTNNDAIAGFLAGSSMVFYPSTSLVIYVFYRVVDAFVHRGVLPTVPGFVPVLYAVSCAFLLHAAVLEPHNLKPSYWKFLNRLTKGMIGQMNRQLIDPFGYDSSSLNPDFWPRYDERFISSALKQFVETGVVPLI